VCRSWGTWWQLLCLLVVLTSAAVGPSFKTTYEQQVWQQWSSGDDTGMLCCKRYWFEIRVSDI
jgi:hypothetical protein